MRLSRQVIAWESFLLVWMIFLLVEGTQLDSMVLCWFLWKFFPSLSPENSGEASNKMGSTQLKERLFEERLPFQPHKNINTEALNLTSKKSRAFFTLFLFSVHMSSFCLEQLKAFNFLGFLNSLSPKASWISFLKSQLFPH